MAARAVQSSTNPTNADQKDVPPEAKNRECVRKVDEARIAVGIGSAQRSPAPTTKPIAPTRVAVGSRK